MHSDQANCSLTWLAHGRRRPPDTHIGATKSSQQPRELQMIDDATSDQDLRVPSSNHFEKLRANLARFHSIRVNSQ